MPSSPNDRVVPLPVALDGQVAADELAEELAELLDETSTPTRFAFATLLAAARLPGVTGTLVMTVEASGAVQASFSSP